MRSTVEGAWLLTVLVLAGCGKDEETGTVDSGVDSECAESYNWTTVGAPFVYTWCTGCHSSYLVEPDTGADTGWDPRQGAPDSLNLDTLEDVCREIDRIEERALHSPDNPMPPGGGPTDEELEALAAWIACGPPECQ